jgi:hypothetical protein
VTVSVTRQGAIGRQSQFTIGGAGKHPTSRSSCLAPGSLSAQVGC